MSSKRIALPGLGLAVLASQAGHLVAYQLRYGGASQQLQSSGAHAYYPTLVKSALGVMAIAILATMLSAGFARLAAGRPIDDGAAPPFVRLLAALFSVQLACYVIQETVEAAAGGLAGSSPALLLLWGTAGQLPVALVGAVALRWLLVHMGPALGQLKLPSVPALRLGPDIVALVSLPIAAQPTVSVGHVAPAYNRRGPPF